MGIRVTLLTAEYVQLKPVIAFATVLCKITGNYIEGRLRVNNGYTWIAFTYSMCGPHVIAYTDISVFVALYSLTIFWMCLHRELKPYGVGAKFLCVKGVIFFSFWQGLFISILVATGMITHSTLMFYILTVVGTVQDDTYLSAALQDTLICLEMPLFALAHSYSFSYKDYVEPPERLAGRMPISYAFRDSFGVGDLLADMVATFHGKEYNYRSWEPCVDEVMPHSYAFKSRSRAGLRYADGGRTKYWVGEYSPNASHVSERTPLAQHEEVPRYRATQFQKDSVQFPDLDKEEQRLYDLSRKLPFGDYRYPCIGPSRTRA